MLIICTEEENQPKIPDFLKFLQNCHEESSVTEKPVKTNEAATKCWGMVFATIKHCDIVKSNAFFSAIKVAGAACIIPLVFKHTLYSYP